VMLVPISLLLENLLLLYKLIMPIHLTIAKL
jgi:hypothetical protein